MRTRYWLGFRAAVSPKLRPDARESTRTIEIDEFVEKSEIDPRYLIRPYYLRPDGKVGHDAFAVKAPLQSHFVAFLLGIWVARRR